MLVESKILVCSLALLVAFFSVGCDTASVELPDKDEKVQSEKEPEVKDGPEIPADPGWRLFAPLEEGAVWEYEWTQRHYPIFSVWRSRFRISVVGDTTIAGQDFFTLKHERAHPPEDWNDRGPAGTFVFDSTTVEFFYLRYDEESQRVIQPQGWPHRFHELCGKMCIDPAGPPDFGSFDEEVEVTILDDKVVGLVRTQRLDLLQLRQLEHVGLIYGRYPGANESWRLTFANVGGQVLGTSRAIEYEIERDQP